MQGKKISSRNEANRCVHNDSSWFPIYDKIYKNCATLMIKALFVFLILFVVLYRIYIYIYRDIPVYIVYTIKYRVPVEHSCSIYNTIVNIDYSIYNNSTVILTTSSRTTYRTEWACWSTLKCISHSWKGAVLYQ